MRYISLNRLVELVSRSGGSITIEGLHRSSQTSKEGEEEEAAAHINSPQGEDSTKLFWVLPLTEMIPNGGFSQLSPVHGHGGEQRATARRGHRRGAPHHPRKWRMPGSRVSKSLCAKMSLRPAGNSQTRRDSNLHAHGMYHRWKRCSASS